MVDLAGNRTPSIEQSCLTETTDCPSDVSVITSISCMPRLQATTSPLSNTSPRGEDSLASRLAPTREEEAIQRAGDAHRPGDTKRRPNPPRNFLPPTQLRALVRDRLQAEGISLSAHPYTQSVSLISSSFSSFHGMRLVFFLVLPSSFGSITSSSSCNFTAPPPNNRQT